MAQRLILIRHGDLGEGAAAGTSAGRMRRSPPRGGARRPPWPGSWAGWRGAHPLQPASADPGNRRNRPRRGRGLRDRRRPPGDRFRPLGGDELRGDRGRRSRRRGPLGRPGRGLRLSGRRGHRRLPGTDPGGGRHGSPPIPPETVVVFTHGGVIRFLICHLPGAGLPALSAFRRPAGIHFRDPDRGRERGPDPPQRPAHLEGCMRWRRSSSSPAEAGAARAPLRRRWRRPFPARAPMSRPAPSSTRRWRSG